MKSRLFCKHTYKHFHTDKRLSFGGHYYTKWHYVCKCGSKKVIDEEALVSYVREKSRLISFEKAKGIDNSEYDNLEFIVADQLFKGKLAYYMKKRLGKFEQNEIIF